MNTRSFFVAGLAGLLFSCAGAPQRVESSGERLEASFSALSVKPGPDFALAEPYIMVYDLAKLRVGMSKAEVKAIFSAPKSTKRTPKDEYWEYAWFELYFRDGRLVNWFNL